MAAKFELYTDAKGEYRFRLKAGNGEVVLSSEGYSGKSAAQNGIDSVKTNSQEPGQYQVKEAANGKFYFVLKAKNHQVIGQGQMYTTKDGAERGTEAVARAAKDAATVEVDN